MKKSILLPVVLMLGVGTAYGYLTTHETNDLSLPCPNGATNVPDCTNCPDGKTVPSGASCE